MNSLHDDIFVSYDHDSEPEPLDSSCTSGKEKCAKCHKLGRRCFRCRLKLALGEESEEPAKPALELVVAPQAAQRNDKSEDTIPEPIPKPIKARNETIRPQKVAQNGETPSPIPRSSSKSQLRDCPSTAPKNSTESFQTSSHDTYFYDGVITSSTQYYESNISSCGANIQSRANDAHRQKKCYLYNHPCSQWEGLAPEPPYYNRSDAEIEVVKINRSWHLVSTKCRIEKYDNSGIEHNHEHRHWAEPSREPPHCNSCRSLEEKKACVPEYIRFYNAKMTFVEQLPWRGYAHAVWVALADTTPSMPGSVLRSTNQYKVSCKVYRDQLYGPGRLVNQVREPDEPIIPLEPVCPSIYDFGRSAVHWAQERITGVKHSDEVD